MNISNIEANIVIEDVKMEDEEKVVAKLKGEEIKEYRIEVSNKLRFLVEATSEEHAEEVFNKIIEDDYDYPYNNAEDYDGWELEFVEEA